MQNDFLIWYRRTCSLLLNLVFFCARNQLVYRRDCLLTGRYQLGCVQRILLKLIQQEINFLLNSDFILPFIFISFTIIAANSFALCAICFALCAIDFLFIMRCDFLSNLIFILLSSASHRLLRKLLAQRVRSCQHVPDWDGSKLPSGGTAGTIG